MDQGFLLKNQVIDNLWQEYSKTSDHKQQRLLGIHKEHQIVVRREERGLKEILVELQKDLANKHVIYRDQLASRKKGDWIGEWLHWHKLLFKYVLKDTGKYRQVDVRFGSPGDEEIHHIPSPQYISPRLAELVGDIQYFLHHPENDVHKIAEQIAIVHYRFISIHPFIDGNGRIGRVLIDQLAIANNLPMVMGGYPRNSLSQRRMYHQAITSAAYDLKCSLLTEWILDKIYTRLNLTA